MSGVIHPKEKKEKIKLPNEVTIWAAQIEFWGEILQILLNPERCGFFVGSTHKFR